MIAWVVIVDTPFFGKTGTDGVGTLTGLAPGEYRLEVWYPGPQTEPLSFPVTVDVQGSTMQHVTLDVTASPLPALRAREQPAH